MRRVGPTTRSASSTRSRTVGSSPTQGGFGGGSRNGRTTGSATPAISPSPSWRRRPSYKTAGKGLQQAKDYAQILDLKFAYATNGTEIIEFDFLTGVERKIDAFPSPEELWSRLRQGGCLADDRAAEQFLTPCYHQPDKQLRYYQQIAIHRVVEAILQGQARVLLTMATGTGKTIVAFQICWKLWNALWNRTGETAAPRSSIWPTATSSSTIRRTRTSSPSAMPA